MFRPSEYVGTSEQTHSSRHWITGTLGGLVCVWVLAADVSCEFRPVRLRLVTVPQPPGKVTSVSLAAVLAIPNARVVAVCRLRNVGASRVDIDARAGDQLLRRISLAPGADTRIDLAWNRPTRVPPAYQLHFVGTTDSWRLESAEIANLHGFSRGLLNFLILPSAQSFDRPPKWGLLAFAACLLLLAGVRPARPTGLWYFGTSLSAGAASTLLVAVAFSPYVTPFRVVLEPRTFVLASTLVWTPRIVAIARTLGERRRARNARSRRLAVLACGVLGSAFFSAAMVQTLAQFDGNYSGFLHISRDVASRAPFLRERPRLSESLILYDDGYDGEFMYLMAFDPFLQRFKHQPQRYRDVVDAPPYRYARVGFSLLTVLISGGRPERYPRTMLWLIVAAHFALAALLGRIAQQHGMSPWTGLWYLAIPGFMPSLLFALPEALAAVGIVAGLGCWETRRTALAVVFFSSALLVRETAVVLIAALVGAAALQRRHRAALALCAALVPFLAWRMFVAWRLFGDFGWEAIITNPRDFGVPFAGLVDLLQAGLARTQSGPEVTAAVIYPFVVTLGLALSMWLLLIRPGPIELAGVLYGAMAVCLNYGKIWVHVPSGERGTFELFLCLLLLLLGSNGRPVRVRGTLTGFFVVLLAYTFLVAPDAATSRAALLLIR